MILPLIALLALAPPPEPQPAWIAPTAIGGGVLLSTGVATLGVGAYEWSLGNVVEQSDYRAFLRVISHYQRGYAMVGSGVAMVTVGVTMIIVSQVYARKFRRPRLALNVGRNYFGLTLTGRF